MSAVWAAKPGVSAVNFLMCPSIYKIVQPPCRFTRRISGHDEWLTTATCLRAEFDRPRRLQALCMAFRRLSPGYADVPSRQTLADRPMQASTTAFCWRCDKVSTSTRRAPPQRLAASRWSVVRRASHASPTTHPSAKVYRKASGLFVQQGRLDK